MNDHDIAKTPTTTPTPLLPPTQHTLKLSSTPQSLQHPNCNRLRAMDLQALSKAGKLSLLTIPRTQEEGQQQAAASTTNNTNDNDDTTAPLLLLQLPKGWTVADLKDSQFVGRPDSTQVSLVVEPKQVSFSLNHVETSNVLVLVPPTSAHQATQQGACKRQKVSSSGSNKTIVPVAARLLTQSAGSGACSFLELREKPLFICDLKQSLAKHVFDPYNTNPYNTTNNKVVTGRTVQDLAAHLATTQAQVQSSLQTIESAFRLPRTNPAAYCLLSEEAVQEASFALVEALLECDDCHDYAVAGVTVDTVVQHVVQHQSAEEQYTDVEAVVRHCLTIMSVTPSDDGDVMETDKVRLDVAKVAVCVARRLFQKQPAPWEASLLLPRWQSELPGVGDAYKVDLDMLRGVAVDVVMDDKNVGDERFYRYLPADKLSTDAARRFERLFGEKETWSMPELEPYLVGLEGGASQSELILRYTTVRTGDDGSKAYTTNK